MRLMVSPTPENDAMRVLIMIANAFTQTASGRPTSRPHPSDDIPLLGTKARGKSRLRKLAKTMGTEKSAPHL